MSNNIIIKGTLGTDINKLGLKLCYPVIKRQKLNNMQISALLGFSVTPDYCPEALAYFARMTVQPDDGLKQLLNDTIVAMKTAGIWDELDQFVFMNLHTAQASTLDVKGNIDHTWVNSPTWQAGVGVSTDGATNYINSHFIASLNSKYQINDAGIYQYGSNNVYGFDGGLDSQGNSTEWGYAGLDNYNKINNKGENVWAASNSDGFGFFGTKNNTIIRRTGGIETSDTRISSNSITVNYYIGANNQWENSPANFHSRLYKQYGFGSSMNLTKRAAFETILNNFNTAVQGLGPEIVDQTQWCQPGLSWWSEKDSGWSGDGTKINSDGTNGAGYLVIYPVLTAGKTYRWEMSINTISGNLNVYCGLYQPFYQTASCNHLVLYPTANNVYIIFYAMNWVGSITYLSVKEVTSI
jgi:hypothetical protein